MTTIVGVLNKRAVAIAADSAVTVGDTHKVMNTGNKLFSLSKFAPVGIAIYGNASLMDTPWEVIIKSYRRFLNRKKYNYLQEYVDDFLQFLRNHEFFSSSIIQKRHLSLQIDTFYRICENKAKKRVNYSINPTQAIIDELTECMNSNQSSNDIIQDFLEYDYSSFIAYAKDEIEAVLKKSKLLSVSDHFDIFAQSYFYYLRVSPISRSGESGLVFVGYGEEEIYPCLLNVIIAIGFEHKLQFRYGEKTNITNEGVTASIVPFAQVETTQTIIRGINPTFYEIIENTSSNVLKSFQKMVSSTIRVNDANLADNVDKLDVSALTKVFTNSARNQFFEKYSRPLVNTIGLLGLSDMANVAESLVSLTSLVQRMSPKEESVGGPVDVAVISKGDGFIWIKRKHYFAPELNSQFFNNYNND